MHVEASRVPTFQMDLHKFIEIFEYREAFKQRET
jgi:hypothetical protein